MDLDRCIKTRISTRKFLEKEIAWDKLTEILNSGRFAPSSGNLQNWRFLIVKDDKTKEKISNFCADQAWMANASTHVIVCNDDSDVKRMYKKRSDLFSTQNCATAIQNILLKANSLGIASCWVGVYNADKLRALLKIPESIKIEAIIVLGYAAEKEKPSPRLTLDKITYFEGWGNTKK